MNDVGCSVSFDTPDIYAYLYNSRSELTNATAAVDSAYCYGYDFDDISNRESSSERGTNITYAANSLNQYTALNQTFEHSEHSEHSNISPVSMSFDRMGRRVTKNDQRFVYDGYLQIADNAGNTYVWDCTEPIATRPLVWLVLRSLGEGGQRGTSVAYYTHDGNKNVSDVIASDTDVAAHYEYAPFGALTVFRGASAAVNPWRFSSEYAEDETATVYYNYRHYEPVMGRWMGRDRIEELGGMNVYAFMSNGVIFSFDRIGLISKAQFKGILDKLLSCKQSDGVLNWDAAIEALYAQALGKNWKQKILELLKNGRELADKIVEYGSIPPSAYEDAKDFLEWAYPDGAPTGLLEKLEGMPPIDYKSYVEGWNRVSDIASIALTLLNDEPVTIDEYADFLDAWLDLSGMGGSLGGPIFLAYYSTLMDGIKEGIDNIVNKLGVVEYQYFIIQDCCQLQNGVYRNNFLTSIRSALSRPRENQKEMK